MASYLVVLNERVAIKWVLEHSRMAFPVGRRVLPDLALGDELLLYSTRKAFHSPVTHRGRVFGRAKATSEIKPLPKPLIIPGIAGRAFASTCELELLELAPPHQGPELTPLAPRLSTFRGSPAWSFQLRRPLVKLDAGDAKLLGDRLAAVALDPGRAVPMYSAAADGKARSLRSYEDSAPSGRRTASGRR